MTSNPDGSFAVRVDDNYHYMDEDERYTAGTFPTYAQALAKVHDIVECSLEEAEFEYGSYTMFGEDPWISPTPDRRRFSAWDYARVRCEKRVARSPTEAR